MRRGPLVVLQGVLVGLGLSACCAGTAAARLGLPWLPAGGVPGRASALLLVLAPAAGPFAEPLARTDYSWPRMLALGAVLAAAISLHVFRPCEENGVVSGVGLAVWFLLGLSYTYAGV